MDFLTVGAFIGLLFLIFDCVEVGRNDAANIVNAVFGARVLSRGKAAVLAGIAVILGATYSSPVIETARKGIFDPTVLDLKVAMTIYISVYFVDTVMLYGFSGFGMPVSTTACLIFELVGASLFLAGYDNVKWDKVGGVTAGIIVSIIVSGAASFLAMRIFRGAVRDKVEEREMLLLHGPWIAGAILTLLTWFMVFKGLRNVEVVKLLKAATFQAYGEWMVLFIMWCAFTLAVHITLVLIPEHLGRFTFHATAVLGMLCMAFAFGQNDLANAASPGLASLTIYWHRDEGQESEETSPINPGDVKRGGEHVPAEGPAEAGPGGTDTGAEAGQGKASPRESTTLLAEFATGIPIPRWALFLCGVLLASGMLTQYAQRVTRAEVNTGSQYDRVALYAPEWCRAIARFIMRIQPNGRTLAPAASLDEAGKKVHYDSLRASVITGVSASVIAFASGHGLPVSTTYVAFAAVLGTGAADRIFRRGDADLKIGRAIWVITCWFLAPVIAVVATGLLARLIFSLSVGGVVLAILINVAVRFFFRQRADEHERKYHPKTKDKGAAPEAPATAEM